MAGVVITDATITINAVDLSSYVQRVEINQDWDELDVTTMGSGGARERKAGLSDGSVSIEFFQDYATSAVDDTISALAGGAPTAVTVKSNSAAISASNPEWQFSALISDWTPLSAAVGETAMASVTWPISGIVTRDITP